MATGNLVPKSAAGCLNGSVIHRTLQRLRIPRDSIPRDNDVIE